MDSADIYLIKPVYENLLYLRETWRGYANDAILRISSNVLRVLLVDDCYGKAWRLIGFDKQPRVMAVDSDAVIFGKGQEYPLEKIDIAVAGGASYGCRTSTYGFRQGTFITDPKKNFFDITEMNQNYREYFLSEFLESTSLVVDGVKLNRREVIQYVCNKLGGTHIDSNRKKDAKEQKFVKLDNRPAFNLQYKDFLFFELLSIGQTIGASSDAEKFINAVKDNIQMSRGRGYL
ncbi:MAG: hypothetical protein ACM3YE_18175 [Bacteroidota bacterium]